jgi:hypothetical protein
MQRAVGAFPTKAEDRIAYEVLEDIALRVQVTAPFNSENETRNRLFIILIPFHEVLEDIALRVQVLPLS